MTATALLLAAFLAASAASAGGAGADPAGRLVGCADRLLSGRTVDGLGLEVGGRTALDGGLSLAHGLLGWHVTWAVILDPTAEPVAAFESYGAGGLADGAFGRMPVPDPVVEAFVACGAQWRGPWPDPAPWRTERSAPTDRPARAPTPFAEFWSPPPG